MLCSNSELTWAKQDFLIPSNTAFSEVSSVRMCLDAKQKHQLGLSSGRIPWPELPFTCYESYQRSVYKTYWDRRPGSLKWTSYLVVMGLYGSVHVQLRFCQFSEMQLKSVMGRGGSGKHQFNQFIIHNSKLITDQHFWWQVLGRV